jgi:hypothetical protein
VRESLALGINTAAMGLLLIVSPIAGLASDGPGTVFPAIDRFLEGAWPDGAARVPR